MKRLAILLALAAVAAGLFVWWDRTDLDHHLDELESEIEASLERIEKLDWDLEDGPSLADNLRSGLVSLHSGTDGWTEDDAKEALLKRVPRAIVPPDVFSPSLDTLRSDARARLDEPGDPAARLARRRELLETLRRAESGRERVLDAVNAEIEALKALLRTDPVFEESTQGPADESHAESAEPISHAESAESAEAESHAESADDGWSFAFPEEPTLGKRLAAERILLEEAVGFENEIPAEAARKIRSILGTPHARLGSGLIHDAWFFPDGSTLHLWDEPSPRVVWK
ncbi:MAG: hypothetical protein II839_00300 [Kiritimatiellae bacterium]|nr:hypothetical protein [Kiritimatiellia bacterium]